MDTGSGWAQMGSLVLAALLGGAAAVGIGAAIDNEEDPETVISTVASEPPAATFEATATGARSVQQIYEEAGPGVVQVTSTSVVTENPFFGPQSASSLGSGFVVDRDGYIITNFHVIENAQEIEVNFS